MKSAQIIIVTGYSGSGKSTALAALEDAGLYCVDNLPVALLPAFLELPPEGDNGGYAFVMDMRDRRFLTEYRQVLDRLRDQGYSLQILFLEAGESVLVQRFSQTRRHHPLGRGKGLLESIRAEKEMLKDLRIAANRVIDTSAFTVHTLKSVILNFAEAFRKEASMRVRVMSFGFKFGLPAEADIVIDVRFLANPHFVPELEPLNGEDERVRDFVLYQPESRIFLSSFLDLMDYVIPLYEREGKSYLTVAVGCTGGKHRSVAVARCVFDHIQSPNRSVELSHRDMML